MTRQIHRVTVDRVTVLNNNNVSKFNVAEPESEPESSVYVWWSQTRSAKQIINSCFKSMQYVETKKWDLTRGTKDFQGVRVGAPPNDAALHHCLKGYLLAVMISPRYGT
jgi:hypothetical protein